MSASGCSQRVRPVRRREEEQRRRLDVEVGAELARLDAVAEQVPHALLVASALDDEGFAPLAPEVPPLAHEHGRHVELSRNHRQVRTESESDAFRGRRRRRDGVEGCVERVGALAGDRPEQVLLRRDVVVERRLLHTERVGQVGERRALVPALGEEPGGDPGELLAALRHGLH